MIPPVASPQLGFGFPSNYSAGQVCIFSTSETGYLTATSFNTSTDNYLIMDSPVEVYSGTAGPINLHRTSDNQLVWLSGDVAYAGGWRLCLTPRPISTNYTCDLSERAPTNTYRPPTDAQPPFNCSGYTSLDLSDRGLATFDASTTLLLDSCQHLQQLSLQCNSFTTISAGGFEGLGSLRELYLGSNSHVISANALMLECI